MISSSDFLVEMQRLHRLFGQEYSPDSEAGERIAKKITGWLEIWNQNFPHTNRALLKKIVDKAALEFERTPTLQQLRDIRRQLFQESKQSTSSVMFHVCDQCGGLGALRARRDGADFCFRCNMCDNWKKHMGECVPMWGDEWNDQGMVLVL